jgi:hypothetical protein
MNIVSQEKRNLWKIHTVFVTRAQETSETIDQYVTTLKRLSGTCEFGTFKRHSHQGQNSPGSEKSENSWETSSRARPNLKKIRTIEETLFVGAVTSEVQNDEWYVITIIEKQNTKLKVDTGLQVNILNLNQLKKIKPQPNLKESTHQLHWKHSSCVRIFRLN